MSCSPFDLRDYALDELADGERRQVEAHLNHCEACREEYGRLDITRATLLSLPDEEIPRRIGFVSDPVFEPSRARRWWNAFWGSPARLGFAGAAMLSIAMLVSALTRPAPAPAPAPAPQVDLARIEVQFSQKLDQAVRKAVTDTEARQEQKTARQLAEVEARHNLELKSIQLAVEQNLSVMQMRYNQMRMYMASNDTEGAAR